MWCRRRRVRPPRAVSSVLGCVSSSGLMVRCSVVSFMIVHAIAVNCSAASASVIGCGGSASTQSMSIVADSSVSASPMYSRTTIDDASAGIGHPLRAAEVLRRRLGCREHERERSGVELEVGVADVAGHPTRCQAGPREHLESEVGGGAAGSGDPVGAVAADHRQQVSAVGVGATDHPRGGAHVEEPRPLRIGLDGQLRAQAGDLGDDPQTVEQFAFISASSVTISVTSASICCTNRQASRVFGAQSLPMFVHGET